MKKNSNDKMIGGVCSGLADHLDLDPLWVRLAFIAAFFSFGAGVITYLVLWLIMD